MTTTTPHTPTPVVLEVTTGKLHKSLYAGAGWLAAIFTGLVFGFAFTGAAVASQLWGGFAAPMAGWWLGLAVGGLIAMAWYSWAGLVSRRKYLRVNATIKPPPGYKSGMLEATIAVPREWLNEQTLARFDDGA